MFLSDSRKIYLLMALSIVISLAGCGSSDGSDYAIHYESSSSDASMVIQKRCVERMRKMEQGETNALKITLKGGKCRKKFGDYFSKNKGEMLRASSNGEPLNAPSKVVGEMQSPYIQPVPSNEQADKILNYYKSIDK